MLASRIFHVVKEPLHTRIQAMYGRRLFKICNRELHISSIILNSDHGKQLEKTFDIELTFDDNQQNVTTSSRKTKSTNTSSHMRLQQNTVPHDDQQLSAFLLELFNYYKAVSLHLDIDSPYRMTYSVKADAGDDNKTSEHVCTLEIKWPKKKTFIGVDNIKCNATRQAVTKCMQWLRKQNRISNGKPNFFTMDELKCLLKKPVKVDVDESMLSEIEHLVERFDNELRDIITFELHTSKEYNMSDKVDIINEVFHGNLRYNKIRNYRPVLTAAQTNRINSSLLENLCNKYSNTVDLPILKYRNEILHKIDTERVVLIRGHTGCGKSTQVPQFIFDSFIERLQGTQCHILISQPRRIAAVTLAQRVAAERNVVLGDTVGYQVRLDEMPLKRLYGMQFCTSGIILNDIIKNPQLMGVTHIIVDEIHEQTEDVEMILYLLKEALRSNSSLKVILMSASVEIERFKNYLDCSVIDVPGILHPVEMNFLDDIAKISDILASHIKNPDGPFSLDLVSDLIRWIDHNKAPGAILCFLPGWSEICTVERRLKQQISSSHYNVLPLHSMLPTNIQHKVFEQPTPNIRKIILSTDIAETSITIPDIAYVVDSCTSKFQYVLPYASLSGTRTEYISQSSIQQRKGRAGRLRPGVSYHLITKKHYESLPVSTTPDILRVPLDWNVLRSKQFSNLPSVDVFKKLLNTPDEKTVKCAVERLINFGAIDENENLTPLGSRLVNISVPPDLGKALLYSVICECASPMSLLTTYHTTLDLFVSHKTNKSMLREIKQKYSSFSDHVAIYRIIKKYFDYFQASQMDDAEDYCTTVQLNTNRMEEFYLIARLRVQDLKNARIIETNEELKDTYTDCEELWCGLLLAATGNITVYAQNHTTFRGKPSLLTKHIDSGIIAPISVCYDKKTFPSSYLISTNYVHSSKSRCSVLIDISVLAPVTVLLFYNGNFVRSKKKKHCQAFSRGNVVLRDKEKGIINLELTSREADILLRFRDVIQIILDYYIQVQGLDMMNLNENVVNFKKDMLTVLCKLLDKASADKENKYV